MASRPLLAALLLIVAPAAAQTPDAPPAPAEMPQTAVPEVPPSPASPPPAPASPAPAAPPIALTTTPAPMPDPLMSPDLQTTSRTQSLAQLVQQSAWQDAVVAAARAQYKEMPQACSSAVFKPTGELVVFAPARFSVTGTLTAGIWSERVNVTGCGASKALNVLTVIQPDGAPQRIPTMPGDSHADPQTQKNALQYAQAIAIRASPPGCQRQTFTDAKFDGYTGLPNAQVPAGRESRAWREDWTLNACGTNYVIEMTFEPNAQGIQLSATNPIKKP